MKARVVLIDGYHIDVEVYPPSLDMIPSMILSGTGEDGRPMMASGRYAVRWWEIPEQLDTGLSA